MNIEEAKKEIKNTIKTYLAKDELGFYKFPIAKQRPLFLVGPPGIGKTAIMQQIAKELRICLVSYTITHHTRQSAIGLPFIVQKQFDGKEYSITEYTMSEIIASIYEKIEQTGIKEGILFLDEINCVSETLSPTMLQFLQYKTFGTHKVPDGFVIVTAGNPPRYNRSVREFDIVTLDRVRQINIDADFKTWKNYALKSRVHGAIISYLDIHNDQFYKLGIDTDGQNFVTARGWEDLSVLLNAYEENDIPFGKEQALEYLHNPEICEDFISYYSLWKKYRDLYQIDDILSGKVIEISTLKNAPFDEKLSILGLLANSLDNEFSSWHLNFEANTMLMTLLKSFHGELKAEENQDKSPIYLLEYVINKFKKETTKNVDAEIIEQDEIIQRKICENNANKLLKLLYEFDNHQDAKESYQFVRDRFKEIEIVRAKQTDETSLHLSNVFRFIENTFGESQEMVLFLSRLTSGWYSLCFVQEIGNEEFYKYNKMLLLSDKNEEIRNEILELQ
ncbi:ATP-binding protein [Butyrivibrio sp. NC3005]|uniref:ATP-binding protein n=1 Tax=Butyrivibrio sp. NC3005 TaxID=1280685 RepID=UPI000410003D|nr:AAA family ATPase [Butyrivibrio sp. NC3005]